MNNRRNFLKKVGAVASLSAMGVPSFAFHTETHTNAMMKVIKRTLVMLR